MRRDGEKRGAAKRKVKPPPDVRARRQAVIFGANTSAFVPAALVKPPPRVKPSGGRATPEERYHQQVETERRRFELAERAPISVEAQIKLRQTETAAERKVRQPPPTADLRDRRVAERERIAGAGLPGRQPPPRTRPRGVPDRPPQLIEPDELLRLYGFEHGSYIDQLQQKELQRWTNRHTGTIRDVDFTPRAQSKAELRRVEDEALEARLSETGIFETAAKAAPGRGQRLLSSFGRNFVVGPELAKAVRGEDFDPKWLALDAVMAPTLLVGPVRGAWAGVRALQGLSGRRGGIELAELAVKQFKDEEARVLTVADDAAKEGRALTQAERAALNKVAMRKPQANAVDSAIGRAQVLARFGYGEQPIRGLLMPTLVAKRRWADVVSRGLKDVEPDSPIIVDVEDDLVGSFRTTGLLRNASKTKLEFIDEDDVVHKIPYGRVIWAGPADMKPPHGLTLPTREEGLAALGTPVVGKEESRSIAREILDRGLSLPERLQDEDELAAAVDTVMQLARDGSRFRDWYVRAAANANILAEHFGITRPQAAQLMAIFSTGNDPTPNMGHAVKAIKQHQAGQKIKAGLYPVEQSKEAEAVFAGKPWEGRKRNSFYANMLRHLDPEEYERLQSELGREGHPVTVDMWVVRMFAPWQKKDVPDASYDAFEQLLVRMGEQLGWDPEEVQAAAWVTAKSRGIISSDIRRGAALGSPRRVSPERANERAGDAYERGIELHLRGGESAADAGVRAAGDRGGARLGGEDLAGVGDAAGRDAGGGLPRFAEFKPTRAGAEKYLEAIGRIELAGRGWAVDVPSKARLGRSRVFLSEGGHSGFAIHNDGELYGVFRTGGPTGVGYEAALQGATRGASWLNVFDIPKVRQGYEDAGFVEVARIRFNAEQAAPGMPEAVGQPDVVFMAFGARPFPVREFEGWDEAVAYTRELARPAQPTGALAREGFEIEQSTAEQLGRYRRAQTGDLSKVMAAAPGGLTPSPADRAQQLARYEAFAGMESRTAWEEAEMRRLEDELGGGVPPEGPPAAPPAPPGAAGGSGDLSPAEIAKLVRKDVAGSAPARREQKYLRLEEAAARGKAGLEAMQGLEGEEALLAARKALKGKFPQVEWAGGLRDLDQAVLDQMSNHITGHPDLLFFEKIRTHAALRKMIRGELPAPNEVTLLNRTFGKETTTSMKRELSKWKKLQRLGVQIYHLPRTMMSTLDLSFGGRQSLVPWARHPRVTGRNFLKMHKQAWSVDAYDLTALQIMEHPYYPLAKLHGIDFMELGDEAILRDEQVLSPLPEKLPKALGGGLFRGSARAYTGMGNTQRMDLFAVGVDRLNRYLAGERSGVERVLPQFRKGHHGTHLDEYELADKALDDIARMVNSSTGRGGVKEGREGAKKVLQSLQYALFSPRLLKSRLDLLNPFYYASLHPVARREALEQFGAMFAMLGFVLGTADRIPGVDVGINPLDSDFAKIRIGDTRIDLLGGFGQTFRMLASVMYYNQLSLRTMEGGKYTTGDDWKNAGNTLLRFARSKLAPVPGVLLDSQMGKDYIGNDFDLFREAWTHMMPILASDIIDMYQEGFPASSFAPYPASIYGVGVSTYKRTAASGGGTKSDKIFDPTKPDPGSGNWWEDDGGSGDWWNTP